MAGRRITSNYPTQEHAMHYQAGWLSNLEAERHLASISEASATLAKRAAGEVCWFVDAVGNEPRASVLAWALFPFLSKPCFSNRISACPSHGLADYLHCL